MSDAYSSSINFEKSSLHNHFKKMRVPLSFDLELTARCNLDCRQCYINLPAGDSAAAQREMSREEISDYADQAVALGSIYCLVTGGEPLLRKDFPEIYVDLKKKGLLVRVFTNGCLINQDHIRLFTQYPPEVIEVTVYGATEGTYNHVVRKPDAYRAFRRGLDLLLESGLRVGLKGTIIRSNAHELREIAEFARTRSSERFKFDPLMLLRGDGDPIRNADILAERMSSSEIVALERKDEEHYLELKSECQERDPNLAENGNLFYCNAGRNHFSISYDAHFRLCLFLHQGGYQVNLRDTNLADAWNQFAPKARDARAEDPAFKANCQSCDLVYLCQWCPAQSMTEMGRLDGYSPYFCDVAHARAEGVGSGKPIRIQP
jgi:radical SAM protein with 4Fe4S-binding SPASM domain